MGRFAQRDGVSTVDHAVGPWTSGCEVLVPNQQQHDTCFLPSLVFAGCILGELLIVADSWFLPW